MFVNNIAKITSRLIDKYAKSCTVTTKNGKVITAKVMTEQLWKKDKVRFETNPTQIGYNQKNYIKCIFALDVTSFGKDDIVNLMGKKYYFVKSSPVCVGEEIVYFSAVLREMVKGDENVFG